MTDHFINRVFANGNYDGSASPTTATGDTQFNYSGNPAGMAVTIYHRQSSADSYSPIFRFKTTGDKIIAMKDGDQYYAVTRGISENTNASLTSKSG